MKFHVQVGQRIRFGHSTSLGKPPFREGIEYRYEWEASIESESAVYNQVTTSTWLRGQIYVISKAEDSKWRSLLRVTRTHPCFLSATYF